MLSVYEVNGNWIYCNCEQYKKTVKLGQKSQNYIPAPFHLNTRSLDHCLLKKQKNVFIKLVFLM